MCPSQTFLCFGTICFVFIWHVMYSLRAFVFTLAMDEFKEYCEMCVARLLKPNFPLRIKKYIIS